MKKLLLSAYSIAISATFAHAQLIDLVSLGTASYLVDPGVTTASYTTNSTGVVFSPSVSLGDTLGGSFISGPLNWSSSGDLPNAIYLKIVFTGANPNLPIQVNIFNQDFSLNNQYDGTTVTAAFPDYYKLDFNPNTPLGLSPYNPAVTANVGGAQITWNGAGNVNASVQQIATIPEPSTYALLAMSGLCVVGYMVRHRRCS